MRNTLKTGEKMIINSQDIAKRIKTVNQNRQSKRKEKSD